ncbi:MAG: D-glycero-alpha-D-manno-heptose-1,7-bisphosphate 7-phosphatase, partial [Aridibacter sp.]
MKQKAVFLDRDGTLIEEVNFLSTVEETELFPFTIEALKLLRDAGFLFFITTNQSGIARGYFDASAVNAIHAKIQNELKANDLRIESFHFCPHLPDAGCKCRKPNTGMLEQTLENFEIDLSKSWMVGDKMLDIEMGFNAGTKTALVKTG